MTTARSLRMASAPSGDHLAPVIRNLSSMTKRQAPSITPVAIGKPVASALSYFMYMRLLVGVVAALAPSVAARCRLLALARVLGGADARVAATALARPCR